MSPSPDSSSPPTMLWFVVVFLRLALLALWFDVIHREIEPVYISLLLKKYIHITFVMLTYKVQDYLPSKLIFRLIYVPHEGKTAEYLLLLDLRNINRYIGVFCFCTLHIW